MVMRVPDKIQGLSIPEYHRQTAYYAGAGRTARADDAFARIGADADSGRWSAAGRFAGAVEDAAGAGEKAYDDYQSVRAAEAYTAFQTAMRERMYGENGIFTRQGEAAFNSEEELENAIRDTVDEMTERMKLNRDAHLKLARSVFGFSSQALPKARRYAADQRLNWANRQDMASIELNRQEFLHNADERNARLLNLITMQEAYNRYAARNGFSAEQKEFGWKKVRSITYSQLAETFINSGNLNAARKLVDEDGLWMEDDRDRIGMRIRARDELLRAREEAEAKSAEQRETRKAVRSAVRDILKDSDGFPSLEEQRDIALGRADALRDPALRQRARREIERELDWRMLRRDARTMRAMLDFRSAARNEGLSPEQRRERLEREDMPEDVRAALCDELERGGERMPDEQNMNRAMNLLRFIDTARAGGRAPTADDILAAGLRGGLTDGQVEGALAYLENDGMLSLSHLDDICLDLGMAPDEHGEVRAPAWLYEGVLRDLARNGQTGNGVITDEMLANSATRVRRRHDARIAAGGADVQDARGQVFDIQYRKSNERKKNRYIQEETDKSITSYRENPLHYDEGAHYYQVLRRQLGCFGENIFTDNPVLDNNLRTEHQHFWGDNGDNFGFMGDGKDILEGEGKVREDTGYSLDDYRDDIPGLGAKKFKGVYIRMAHDILQNNFGNYNFILNNCQDYVDEVIHIANILAKKNNDMLEIT